MRVFQLSASAICAISLSALAQSVDPSPAREIAKIDGEYSNLSIAKGMPAASVEYLRKTASPSHPAPLMEKSIGPGAPIFRVH
jgi:hypothetical protein